MSRPDFYTLNCRGRVLALDTPRLMGILNVTPDSFSDGGRYLQPDAALRHAEAMIHAGADIIDIGGYSSRPYADDIPVDEELSRVNPVIEAIRHHFPDTLLSIDTFRSRVAGEAYDRGIHLVNDISGGQLDPAMIPLVGSWRQVPYLLMHMQGTPQTMQDSPQYEDLVQDIWMYFVRKIEETRVAGIMDLVLDPGFGFGKTIDQNFRLLEGMDQFQELGYPLLAGLSRKSMLYKALNTHPEDVLPQAQVLHDHALRRGARILRVHDVAEARKTIQLFQRMQENGFV